MLQATGENPRSPHDRFHEGAGLAILMIFLTFPVSRAKGQGYVLPEPSERWRLFTNDSRHAGCSVRRLSPTLEAAGFKFEWGDQELARQCRESVPRWTIFLEPLQLGPGFSSMSLASWRRKTVLAGWYLP